MMCMFKAYNLIWACNLIKIAAQDFPGSNRSQGSWNAGIS
jgi:hypothetical protein